MNQKSIIVILGVVVVILISTTVYFATSNKSTLPVAPAPKVVQQPTQPTTTRNGNLESYVNTKYGYQINYDSKIYTINAFNSEPRVSQASDNVLFFRIGDLDSSEPLATVGINVFPNPLKLSSENYLKQNYSKWLGAQSNYSDFYINELTTFNGFAAIKFGTEREQYILVTKDDFALTITTGDLELIKTFRFTK